MNLPKAKTDNIVVQDLQSELLVYDMTTNQAYTLNETSKLVYQSCDGKQTLGQLKRKYKFTDDLIHLALDELKANNLLTDYQSNHFKGLSRREIVKRVGLASMIALPLIIGITVPSAAQAASSQFAPGSRSNNQTCTTPTDCVASSPQCVDTINGFLVSQGTRCCVASAIPNGTARTSGSRYAFGASNQGQCDNIAQSQCCSGKGTLNGTDCFCQ